MSKLEWKVWDGERDLQKTVLVYTRDRFSVATQMAVNPKVWVVLVPGMPMLFQPKLEIGETLMYTDLPSTPVLPEMEQE
jgi:hypothetical protein